MRRGKRPAAGGTGPGLPGPVARTCLPDAGGCLPSVGASGPFSCPVVTTDPSVFPARAPAAPSRPPRAVARAPVPLNARPVSPGPAARVPVGPSPFARPAWPSRARGVGGRHAHHPASEKAPVTPNPPGSGHPSGCGSRGRRGQAGSAARCWCDVPVWRRRVRRGGIGCTKRVHKRVVPTEGGRSRLCVWFPDPAMTPPDRLPQEDPLRGRRPLSRPYVGWVSGESRAEEENE